MYYMYYAITFIRPLDSLDTMFETSRTTAFVVGTYLPMNIFEIQARTPTVDPHASDCSNGSSSPATEDRSSDPSVFRNKEETHATAQPFSGLY